MWCESALDFSVYGYMLNSADMYRDFKRKYRTTPDGRDWSPGIRQTPEGHESSYDLQVSENTLLSFYQIPNT